MSLLQDGLWKAGLLSPGVWANGVWFENAEASSEEQVNGGGGSRKRRRKVIRLVKVNQSDSEIAFSDTQERMTQEVEMQAAQEAEKVIRVASRKIEDERSIALLLAVLA